jgi:hypothetical protein
MVWKFRIFPRGWADLIHKGVGVWESSQCREGVGGWARSRGGKGVCGGAGGRGDWDYD